MRILLWVTLSSVILIMSLLTRSCWREIKHRSSQAAHHLSTKQPIQPTIESLCELSQLVTLQVHVAEVLTTEKRGWFSGYQGIWVVKGDALYTTDLEQASIKVVRRPDTTEFGQITSPGLARIEVPLPEIAWARVNHDLTYTHDIRKNALIPIWGAPEHVRDSAMRRAQQLVQDTASQPKYQRMARERVRTTLSSFCHDIGYEAEVVFPGR